MPFIIPENLKFYKYNNINYISIDSDYFGRVVRFGDFVMMSSSLFIIKLNIMKKYDYLNKDNFFFYIKNKRNIKLNNFNNLQKLFKNLYKNDVIIKSNDYDFKQILPKGNLWLYKCYLDNCNYRIDNDYKMIVPNISLEDINKNTVYILPVFKKAYNKERNWTIKMLIDIIKNISLEDNIKIISIDNYKLSNKDKLQLKEIREDIIFLTKVSWQDIINGISLTCKEFISGDCGMMHFVSALSEPYSPSKIKCFYNTRGLVEDIKTFYKYFTNHDSLKPNVNFKPYALYKNTNIEIIKFP